MATVGASVVTASAVSGSQAETAERKEDEPQRQADETGDVEITNIDIALDHGDQPGQYEAVETVYEEDFHVVFQATKVTKGAFLAVIQQDTQEIQEVKGDEIDGSGDVSAWPAFSPSGLIFDWDRGSYTAIVTVTDIAKEETDTASIEFQIS